MSQFGADPFAWFVPPLRLRGCSRLRGRGPGPLKASFDRDTGEMSELFEMPAAFLNEEVGGGFEAPPPHGPAEDLGGATIVGFGKYIGKTYEEVLHEYPYYCTWMQQTDAHRVDENSLAVCAFLAWLSTQDVAEVILSGSCKLDFGKHAGETFEDVLRTDPFYCHFIIDVPGHESVACLNDFADWLADQEIPEAPEANGATLVGFGKYNDKTYEEVLHDDPDYCIYLQQQAEGSKASGSWSTFKSFMWWLARLPEDDQPQCSAEGRVLFGKYRGETFENVLEQDPAYCGFILQSAEASPTHHLTNFMTFAEWLKARGFKPPPPEEDKVTEVREVGEDNL